MSPANSTSDNDRGFIIPIGGGEEKFKNPEILDRFIELCGGKEARIGIIPTASELEDTGRNYEKLFRRIGVKHARVLNFISREDCQSGEDVEYIDKCDGVFMTGGNQLRLSTTLGGTAVAQLIRRRNAEGMNVAGTSAGAAFMPEHMIAGGKEGSTPHPDMVTMAPGLGSDQCVHHRSAFPRAGPAGSIVDRARLQPVRRGHWPRRGHGRVYPSGRFI